MKKLAALFVIAVICCGVGKAQYVSLPDSNFRNYLRNIYPTCFNSAGQMDTTCSEIVNEDSLNVYGIGINDLTGLEYFKNLIYLDCKNNYQLNFLPTLPENLVYLNCNYNALAILPALPINLKVLQCWGNQLISLPALPQGLEELSCFENQLSSLPTLPQNLTRLECYRNQISSLPTLPPNLTYLDCSINPINSLPALPPNLTNLFCYLNQLSSLPTLPQNLWRLSCSNNFLNSLPALPLGLGIFNCENNQLTSLPMLPINLRQFACSNNQLDSLPALPENLTELFCRSNQLSFMPTLPWGLRYLYCSSNPLRSLPILPQNLADLECSNCQLSLLPVLPSTVQELMCSGNRELYCLPFLPASLYRLEIGNQIMCIPNRPFSLVNITIYDAIGNNIYNPIPICNPLNNSNNCQFYPLIHGSVFYDNNNNGIKDADEPMKKNIKLSLSSSRFTFTNNDGFYETGADSLASYTLTVNPTRYFDVIPASINYNFTSYDTLVTKEFALQANTVIDELTLHITPINWAARPGFSFPYLISYENTGTTNLSPNIVFDYDETRLTYNSSSVAGVVDNNSNLAFNVGSITPGQSGSFIGYFNLKPTAVIGDSLRSNATISAGTYTISDNNTVPIRGSFDPNDKQATPQLSPSQVANGNYIDYTIRFQNTGTDTAFNIVISDTLSEDLQANTLQMITSSHNCKATVKDNIVFFEFLNILLPDSNVNEAKSHGFVSFKIKPQSTVAVNTTITNKAAIYFDYNAPVITNTVGTLIKDFIVVPLRLISFSAVPQTDNTTTLYWNTANEINSNHFVIEQSSDGAGFISLKNVVAKGRTSNNYSSSVNETGNSLFYYRLKIVDNDGTFSYSPIIKIDRRKNTSGIAVLTNPVKDFIIINTTDRSLNNTAAGIINMQGAVVKNFIVKEGSQSIDIKDLPAGIYYLRTVNGSSRFIIQ
jgi:uncharacterized repeat protein (TIGR01451 family)